MTLLSNVQPHELLSDDGGLDRRSIFWTNLLLLGLEPRRHPGIALHSQVFASHAGAGKAMEVIVHFLLTKVDGQAAKERFATCWPVLDRGHAREFRIVAVKWLDSLKKDGHLPPDVSVRKSHFDECRGERFEHALLALSNFVLRKEMEVYGEDPLERVIAVASRDNEDLSNILRNQATEHARAFAADCADDSKEQGIRKGYVSDMTAEYSQIAEQIKAREADRRNCLNEFARAYGKPVGLAEALRDQSERNDAVRRQWQRLETWMDLNAGNLKMVEDVLNDRTNAWVLAGFIASEVGTRRGTRDLTQITKTWGASQANMVKSLRQFVRISSENLDLPALLERAEGIRSSLLPSDVRELKSQLESELAEVRNAIARKRRAIAVIYRDGLGARRDASPWQPGPRMSALASHGPGTPSPRRSRKPSIDTPAAVRKVHLVARSDSQDSRTVKKPVEKFKVSGVAKHDRPNAFANNGRTTPLEPRKPLGTRNKESVSTKDSLSLVSESKFAPASDVYISPHRRPCVPTAPVNDTKENEPQAFPAKSPLQSMPFESLPSQPVTPMRFRQATDADDFALSPLPTTPPRSPPGTPEINRSQSPQSMQVPSRPNTYKPKTPSKLQNVMNFDSSSDSLSVPSEAGEAGAPSSSFVDGESYQLDPEELDLSGTGDFLDGLPSTMVSSTPIRRQTMLGNDITLTSSLGRSPLRDRLLRFASPVAIAAERGDPFNGNSAFGTEASIDFADDLNLLEHLSQVYKDGPSFRTAEDFDVSRDLSPARTANGVSEMKEGGDASLDLSPGPLPRAAPAQLTGDHTPKIPSRFCADDVPEEVSIDLSPGLSTCSKSSKQPMESASDTLNGVVDDDDEGLGDESIDLSPVPNAVSDRWTGAEEGDSSVDVSPSAVREAMLQTRRRFTALDGVVHHAQPSARISPLSPAVFPTVRSLGKSSASPAHKFLNPGHSLPTAEDTSVMSVFERLRRARTVAPTH
ncbi:hypothetical protein HKX48_000930 [Thoreauomyces humboldtii]|nr:hypothetical protein HKX48_000930 [Thoreauomyces humboldtii]